MNKKLFSLVLFAFLLGLYAEKTNAQASGVKPELIMYRHNGGGITPAPVAVDNIIGTVKWNGLTAIGSIVTGASIRSVAKQVSPGLLKANMVFGTSGNDRVIINETGLVGIGTMTPQYHLDVEGNTHTSGRFFGRIHFDFGMPTDLPSSYLDEAYFEHKTRTQLGLGANTYSSGGILSLAPGNGSLDRQLFTGGDDGLWTRSQELAGGNTWAAWEKILTSGDINGRPNLLARFLPPGPTSSKLGDSQLYDDGSNVVIGGIPAAPAAPTPVFNAADMLTVNGNSRTTGNSAVNGNATVTGSTTTGTLSVGTTANIGGLTTTNSLSVTNNATVNGNATVQGNVGIGKAPTTFDLDVAGESNFDGRVKVGAASFPGSTDYELAVGGGIIAEEVLVQLEGSWPDYVFAADYKLKPLAEVENFIAEKKHLPGVVSAQEVAENGLNLGEMQQAQMEKIEELFLHMIAMNKELNAIKAENSALKAKLEQLNQRN
ncbi:MAG: hypothetical protein Q7T20_11570 [Saprospiraceae bacterium]|nr:hypothetical protein [Saprospiraceae bacterium]